MNYIFSHVSGIFLCIFARENITHSFSLITFYESMQLRKRNSSDFTMVFLKKRSIMIRRLPIVDIGFPLCGIAGI